jgi:hypothetical protein
MKKLFPVLVFFAGLGCSVSFAQAVSICSDGKPCVPETHKRRCAEEKVSPNLSIAGLGNLTGVLLDETGAPINLPKTLVQIRDPKADTVLFSAGSDEKGRFDLGAVPAGEYRFLVVWLKDGNTRRFPLADQPKTLSCSAEKGCNLKIVIHFHGTDNPIDFCLPK